jgi:transposase
MARVEIFQGRARRRWSDQEKRRLVAETCAPGATVHGVARRHGVNTSQLFTWRKRFRVELAAPAAASAIPGFAAVAIVPSTASPIAGITEAPLGSPPPSSGLIEIELADGSRVRISSTADPTVVTAALRALVGR